MTDDRFHSLLALLRDNGWPVPEAGYELAGDNGEILACAELGWEALKIAFLVDPEIEYQPQFAAFGWKTALISEVLADAQRFMSMKDMP
jgi:DEAD/DEAH box helicase domain-containing protein